MIFRTGLSMTSSDTEESRHRGSVLNRTMHGFKWKSTNILKVGVKP